MEDINETPESPRLESTESITEFNLSRLEIVGETEIAGFERSGLLTNEQVAEHLRENIPPTHLEGCPSLEYAPNHSLFTFSHETLAFFLPASREIKVASGERFRQDESMVESITHEIGHNEHLTVEQRSPHLAQEWENLYKKSGGNCISDYARTDVHEDFAESYRWYIHHPEDLRFRFPEEYEFMRQHVFASREYVSAGPTKNYGPSSH